MFKKISILAIIFSFLSSTLIAAENQPTRFFYSGDGKISFKSNKSPAGFAGAYRTDNGIYDEAALKQIAKVFGCSFDPEKISLRLIEFFDYLQDHFNGGIITIISGYRSPQYNKRLRKNGALAGKASLHQYGMAADIHMARVPSKKIWEYVRELKFGGTGYYHGKNVHLDVGPARWWDETSSKVDTDIAEDNKLIILVNDRDIYLSGETVALDFARMTAWPIGVKPVFFLEEVKDKKSKKIKPEMKSKLSKNECRLFDDLSAMQNLSWQIPKNQKPGRYRIRAQFCEKKWEAMPDEISTPDFVIHAPLKVPLEQTHADKF